MHISTTFHRAALLCAALLMSVPQCGYAQRKITSFRDTKITQGGATTIDGQRCTEPDIYLKDNGDGTFAAHRLTVQPSSTRARATDPYLSQMTPHSVVVCWKTALRSASVEVAWGEKEDALDHTVPFTTEQLATSYYWNRAEITGLEPAHEYYYRVKCNGVAEKVFRFRTMPADGDDGTLRVLLIGDHQRNENSDYEWLLKAAKRKLDEKYGEAPLEDHVNFLMNVGDQVDGGNIDLYETVHLYKNRQVMSRLPIMTAVGNHETFNDPDVSLYEQHYAHYGTLPYRGIQSGTAKWYAYQTGSVLWLVMDSDHTTAEQKLWVRRVVEAADADPTVSFIVSVQHRPLYAEMYAYDVSRWMNQDIIPILQQSPKHVLNYSGHHHLYARGALLDQPLYHIISGGGVGTYNTSYEQLWGVCLVDNVNRDEVQKTIDHSSYQLVEFDPKSRTMTVETYIIGNRRMVVDNECVDSFSRCTDRFFISLHIPLEPQVTNCALLGAAETTTPTSIRLPYTFSVTDVPARTDTVQLVQRQFQVATDADFTHIVREKVLSTEDMYGVDEHFRPLNISQGIDQWTLADGDVPNGTYYLRVRSRNANLDWGYYSPVYTFTVQGQKTKAVATLTSDKLYYRVGETVTLTFANAPVGTDAWVGVYEHDKSNTTGSTSYKWAYTTKASGTLTFNLDQANEYYAVLFSDGGYNEITERIPLYVTDNYSPDKPFELTTDRVVYEPGQPVMVTVKNCPNINQDWVGIFEQSVTPRGSKCPTYMYVTGTEHEFKLNAEGSRNFTAPCADGVYFVSYFLCDSYTEPFQRKYFVVGKPVALAAGAPSYTEGDEVKLIYEGMPLPHVQGNLTCQDGEDDTWQTVTPLVASGGVIRLGRLAQGTYRFCVMSDGQALSPTLTITVTAADGISQPVASADAQQPSGLYQLDGRRVSAVNRPGIYIRDGKKISIH